MKRQCLIVMIAMPLLLWGQNLPQKQYIDSLLAVLPKRQNDTTKIKVFEDLAFAFATVSPDSGIYYGNKAVILARQLKQQKWIASGNGVLAINYQAKSDIVKSVELNQASLTIYAKLKDFKGMAAIYTNLSKLYLDQSNYAEALKNAFRALKGYEEYKSDKNRGVVIEIIGHIYFEQQQYTKAKKCYFQALALYRKSGSKTDIARCMGNMARVFQTENKSGKALDYLFSALKVNEELGIQYGIQHNYANIGNIYSKSGQYRKAIRYHSAALKISRELGLKNSIAINYGNLGEAYLEMEKNTPSTLPEQAAQNKQQGIAYLEKAVAICAETGFSAPEIEFRQVLIEAYGQSGDYRRAFENLQATAVLKDSVFSQQSKIELAGLEANRDIEIKNKDIIIKNKLLEIKKLEENRDQILYLSGIIILFIIIFILIQYFIRRVRRQRNAMDNMIRIQSHEIRGPVASILGLTQLLNLNLPDDPQNAELLKGIHTLATDLDEVVTRVIVDSAK